MHVHCTLKNQNLTRNKLGKTKSMYIYSMNKKDFFFPETIWLIYVYDEYLCKYLVSPRLWNFFISGSKLVRFLTRNQYSERNVNDPKKGTKPDF